VTVKVGVENRKCFSCRWTRRSNESIFKRI